MRNRGKKRKSLKALVFPFKQLVSVPVVLLSHKLWPHAPHTKPYPIDKEPLQQRMLQHQSAQLKILEVGLKPVVEVDAKKIKVTRYKINVTDEMVQEEVERLQIRNGKMTEPEEVTGDDNVLNVKFIESDAKGNFSKSPLTKKSPLSTSLANRSRFCSISSEV